MLFRTSLWLIVASSVASLPAFASSSGRTNLGATGCNQCHSGGTAPSVMLTGLPAEIAAGATVTVTVTLTTPNGNTGGFNLTPSAGTLTNAGAGAKIVNNQGTHANPKAQSNDGNVSFTVDWTAPETMQTVNFVAWGNSVNGNGANTGDRAASDAASVNVCTTTFYVDGDMDGFGGAAVVACTQPVGAVATGGDCDDTNAAVNPNATETCNLMDDNCNNLADEGVGTAYSVDGDGDGYGHATDTMNFCNAPGMGYATNNTDCDDANAQVSPGGMEACNGVDDDCDGTVDEDPSALCGGNQTCAQGTCQSNQTADAGTGGTDAGVDPVDPDAPGCGCAGTAGAAPLLSIAVLVAMSAARRRRARN